MEIEISVINFVEAFCRLVGGAVSRVMPQKREALISQLKWSCFVNRTFLVYFCFLVVGLLPNGAQALPNVRFASFSSTVPAQDILHGDLKTGPEHFAKLALVFNEPMRIDKVLLKSCDGKDWSDGIDFFFAPGARHAFVEAGRHIANVTIPSGKSEPIRSLSVVFGRNENICVNGLRVLDREGREMALTVAETWLGKLIQKVSVKPLADHDSTTGLEAFDSYPSTVGFFDKNWAFEFDTVRTFDRIFVWHSVAEPRAHALEISGDGGDSAKGYFAKVELAHANGIQEIKLKTPFKGQRLTLQSIDGGVGELRFGFEKNTARLQPVAFASSPAAQEAFASVGLGQVIDRELAVRVDTDKLWLFRFRSDGTFFIRGFDDDMRIASALSAIGSYRILKIKKNSVELALNGIRAATPEPWDGALCPLDCGIAVDKRDVVVHDTVEIEATKTGSVMVRNRSPRSRRTLPFSDLKAVNGALED